MTFVARCAQTGARPKKPPQREVFRGLCCPIDLFLSFSQTRAILLGAECQLTTGAGQQGTSLAGCSTPAVCTESRFGQNHDP